MLGTVLVSDRGDVHMFFHILIWPPSCENLFSIPLISAELIGNGLPNRQCAAHMSVTLNITIHWCS
jgi:hypothetical protein